MYIGQLGVRTFYKLLAFSPGLLLYRFQFSVLYCYTDDACCNKVINQSKLNEELMNLNGRTFDPKWPITYAVSNVILNILFGKNFSKSHPKDISTIVESGIGYLSSIDISIEV